MRKGAFLLAASLATTAGVASIATAAHAETETVLYSFLSKTEAFGRLEQDGTGSLYGTSTARTGAVYRLQQQNGGWAFKSVFKFNGGNGRAPYAGLIADRANAIFYGVTLRGGSNDAGTVFSLSGAGNAWNESVLHSFSGTTFSGSDGGEPASPLYRDKPTGDLFGTGYLDGFGNCGTVFQLHPSGADWSFGLLYSFSTTDGCNPDTQLKPGPKTGSLVGATHGGGTSGYGTLFEMKLLRGVWHESVIHSFDLNDGAYPSDLDEGNGWHDLRRRFRRRQVQRRRRVPIGPER